MRNLKLVPLVALFAAGLAHAQFFSDEQARKSAAEANARASQLAQQQRTLEDRLLLVEQQLKSGGLIDLANQTEALRADLAKLRGQIEVLAYELAEAQKRQRDLYVDLDSRMRRIESAPQASAAPAPPPSAASTDVSSPPAFPVSPTAGAIPATSGAGAPAIPPLATAPGSLPPRSSDPAAEQRAYDAALDLFKRGDYAGAITGFTSYLRAYPRTPLSSSAQYWIGNAHFARRDYRTAITAQRTLIANYPDSAKVPDALLNIASAQSELGDTAGARRTLEEIVAKHPQSEAAPKARQRLAGR